MKRMKNKHFAIMAIGFIVSFTLIFVVCSTPGASQKSELPAVSISGNGVPGKVMGIDGTGFIPGEVIELVLEMEDVPIIVGRKGKIIKVKKDGTFSAKTNYPNKYVAIPGSWDLIATGDKGSTAKCKVQIIN